MPRATKYAALDEVLDKGELAELRTVGAVHGFKTNGRRRRAWRRLFHLDATTNPASNAAAASTPRAPRTAGSGAAHSSSAGVSAAGADAANDDENDTDLARRAPQHYQISLDVRRSFHFDVCAAWTPAQRKGKLAQLGRVLRGTFPPSSVSFPFYVQGLHDVASVLLLVLDDEEAASRILAALAETSLRGYLQPDLESAKVVMRLALQLVGREDAELCEHLRKVGGGDEGGRGGGGGGGLLFPSPLFALPWVLTWFSHSSDSLACVARLFDFFLSSGSPLSPLYVVAALLLHFRDEAMGGEGGGGVDEAEVFVLLSSLPKRLRMESVGAEGVGKGLRGASVHEIVQLAVELAGRHSVEALLLEGQQGRGRGRPSPSPSPAWEMLWLTKEERGKLRGTWPQLWEPEGQMLFLVDGEGGPGRGIPSNSSSSSSSSSTPLARRRLRKGAGQDAEGFDAYGQGAAALRGGARGDEAPGRGKFRNAVAVAASAAAGMIVWWWLVTWQEVGPGDL